jgi:hypothetical protein
MVSLKWHSLFDVGSKHRAVSAKELLTSPNNYIQEVKRNYYCYARQCFEGNQGDFQLEWWKKQYWIFGVMCTKKNYCGVTIHYIANGKLEDLVPCMRKLQ